MGDIPTVDPMPYSEFRSRYEEDQRIPMTSALDKTAEISEELPRSAVFGSLTAYPEIYGVNKMQRPTDRTIDLVTTEEEIEEVAELEDVWSPQENCYFFDHNGWAVGLMAADSEVFSSDIYQEPTTVPEEELDRAQEIETEAGQLDVIRPEINYRLKARRYTESMLQDDYVKTNDLADMASMSLKQVRKGDNYDREDLARTLHDHTEGQMPLQEWIQDTQIRTDAHLNNSEWEELEKELQAIKNEYQTI